jgi:hypothetical protein
MAYNMTKGELIKFLGMEAIGFIDFLNNTTDLDALRLRTMWDSVENIDVGDSFVQNALFPLLVSKGAISQTKKDELMVLVATSTAAGFTVS